MAAVKRSERELELEDILSDFLNGFAIWRDSKVGTLEWTDIDELFSRWVEHGPAADEL